MQNYANREDRYNENRLFQLTRQKRGIKTFRNVNASNEATLEDVLITFRRKYVSLYFQARANRKDIKANLILKQNHYQ